MFVKTLSLLLKLQIRSWQNCCWYHICTNKVSQTLLYLLLIFVYLTNGLSYTNTIYLVLILHINFLSLEIHYPSTFFLLKQHFDFCSEVLHQPGVDPWRLRGVGPWGLVGVDQFTLLLFVYYTFIISYQIHMARGITCACAFLVIVWIALAIYVHVQGTGVVKHVILLTGYAFTGRHVAYLPTHFPGLEPHFP